MAIGKTNAGGGGSGATLTVTGVAGAIVTASKDGKTYTRTINSAGIAVFKGLATGTWTVTMSGGGQTSTRTITITADYELTIAYFSATISITYPAASTCIVTDSSGTQVASDTNGDSSVKTWNVTVGATGAYTITAASTSGSESTSESVSVTAAGQTQSVVLSYGYVIYSDSESAWKNGYSLALYYNLDSGCAVHPEADPPYIEITSGGKAGGRTNNTLDVTEYNTLEITCSLTGSVSNWKATVGLDKNTGTGDLWWYGNPSSTGMAAYFQDYDFTKTVKRIDISKLTGNYFLKIDWGSKTNPSKFTIYDIRLVK